MCFSIDPFIVLRYGHGSASMRHEAMSGDHAHALRSMIFRYVKSRSPYIDRIEDEDESFKDYLHFELIHSLR